MAQAKGVGGDGSDEISLEELSAQINALKTDMAELTKSVSLYARQRGEHVVDDARSQARSAIHRGEERIDSLQKALADLPEEALSTTRQQPAAALGLAAGLGFIFGFMTARK